MSVNTSPQFVCYQETPAAHLSVEERAVLQVIREARGFFATRGLTASDVVLRLRHHPDIRKPNPQRARVVCKRLEKAGLLTRMPVVANGVTVNRWKVARRG